MLHRVCDCCGIAPALPVRGRLIAYTSDASVVRLVTVELRNTRDVCGSCLLRHATSALARWIARAEDFPAEGCDGAA